MERPSKSDGTSARPDRGRQDFGDALAVIALAPSFLYPRGGRRDERGTWVEDPDDTRELFGPFVRDLQRAVADLAPVAPGGETPADPQRYHIGPPATGGMYEFVGYIMTVASAVNLAMQPLDTWLAVGERGVKLLREANGRFRRWAGTAPHRGTSRPNDLRVLLTAPFIEAICLHHAHENYYNSGDISIKSHIRNTDPVSVNSPTGAEQYTTQIAIDRRIYIYVVDGHANVFEHLLANEGLISCLKIPEFSEYMAGNEADSIEDVDFG